MMSEIDPIAFGELRAKVDNLEKTTERMAGQIEELLALANKSKGSLWMGMALASAFSAVVGWGLSAFTGEHRP